MASVSTTATATTTAPIAATGQTARSKGVDRLLKAEAEATKIVQQARQYRIKRAKEARDEAEKEIEALKEQRKRELQEYEQQHAGDAVKEQERIAKETEVQIAEIRATFNKNRDAAVEHLLKTITSVTPRLHPNIKVAESNQA
ncbi:H+-ATPase G subunit-domain-containing protein [Syncephalis pseudoplumigaleata]|uniref:V-type proton ATPase subunit G n=1 Tax=Syncephalis pseudoplumigaleata TaxID=1712513 RepID=A0A4P9YVY6_9FUNG|nr:H+-ATPase G subunit-domain-containing protein [Syncephalis pseudoplumigaleata]|eukprot:RKP24216.1 H+-ATPase G subunit-domain-containing protein [Syncephalis pseudoplumigaleata]